MTEFATRLIEAQDLPKVLEMVQALAAHHNDTATLDLETLERDALGARPWVTVLVAEHRGQIVGYAALCPLLQWQFGVRGMDIHHLFVAPEVRRMGVGRVLIEAALAEAKAQACRYVTVGTLPDNMAAQAVYRAVGFDDMPPPGPRFRVRL